MNLEQIVDLDVPSRHTYFQLNFFILGKEPTHQAKLKRCVDELKVRKKSVESMKFEVEELQDKNHLIYSEILKCEDEIKKRMANRRIVANEEAISDLKFKIKNIEEEILFFVEAFNKLNLLEPMKEWDSMEVQSEYWNAKIKEELNSRLMMGLPIDVEILKTALALPGEVEVKKYAVNLINQKKFLSCDGR